MFLKTLNLYGFCLFLRERKDTSITALRKGPSDLYYIALRIMLCVGTNKRRLCCYFQHLTEMVRHWRGEVRRDGQSPVERGYCSLHESKPHKWLRLCKRCEVIHSKVEYTGI